MATCDLSIGEDGSMTITFNVSAGELASAGLTPGESATVTTEDASNTATTPQPAPSSLPGE